MQDTTENILKLAWRLLRAEPKFLQLDHEDEDLVEHCENILKQNPHHYEAVFLYGILSEENQEDFYVRFELAERLRTEYSDRGIKLDRAKWTKIAVDCENRNHSQAGTLVISDVVYEDIENQSEEFVAEKKGELNFYPEAIYCMMKRAYRCTRTVFTTALFVNPGCEHTYQAAVSFEKRYGNKLMVETLCKDSEKNGLDPEIVARMRSDDDPVAERRKMRRRKREEVMKEIYEEMDILRREKMGEDNYINDRDYLCGEVDDS